MVSGLFLLLIHHALGNGIDEELASKRPDWPQINDAISAGVIDNNKTDSRKKELCFSPNYVKVIEGWSG